MSDHLHPAPRSIVFAESSPNSTSLRRRSILGTAELSGGGFADDGQDDGELDNAESGDILKDMESGGVPGAGKSLSYSRSSARASKHSVKDAITSHFDTWRYHDIKIRIICVCGIVSGIALVLLTHVGSQATVPDVAWFNALHVAVGLVCLAVERCCALAAMCCAQTYTAAALLGEEGVSLHHVAQCFGGVFSAMRCLFGDRQRLRKAQDHATLGRRPNGLVFTATLAFLVASTTPILHVLLVLGTHFEAHLSPLTGFRCDVPDYSTVQPVNFTNFVRGADYYLSGITTASMVANIGSESFVVAGIDADGHSELTTYVVEEKVQALRVQVSCDDPVSTGPSVYPGSRPVAAGITDYAIMSPTSECQDSFCLIRLVIVGFGSNGTKTDCVASTQTVSVRGLSTMLRVKGARSFLEFTINSDIVEAGDPDYARLWRRGSEQLDEVVGRWPRDGWMGGLAFELAGDPPFNGNIDPDKATHIVYRFIGGLHRLTSGSYKQNGSMPCNGYAPLGGGKIGLPTYGHALGIAFGAGAAFLSLYTFTSERDIQLMVGARNYRRAVSALESPLRFAALLDGSEAAHAFSKMCDETPRALERVGAEMLVSMGGSMDVGGPVGHACISTVETIDSFSPTRAYTGRPAASPNNTLRTGWHRPPRPMLRRFLFRRKGTASRRFFMPRTDKTKRATLMSTYK
ncbi:hypothetical protein HDU86_005177 [Geranomyces michiganensis]|nr:hypothetical protein HDU86_005177 [Geranomyces michiganensis]